MIEITKDILTSPDLTATDKLLWGYIRQMPIAVALIRDFSEALGVTETTIHNSIKRLERMNLITVTRHGRGVASFYKVV